MVCSYYWYVHQVFRGWDDLEQNVFYNVLNRKWIFAHGAPKKILTDKGVQFDSGFFRQNAEFFKIKVSSTAANSPISNGSCERHMILTERFQKVKSELNTSDDEQWCIQAAVFAKNCLLSHLVYSPFQLVYGRSPRLPCMLDDGLPALETPGGSFPDHLKALQAAREAFTAAESSDRIKRALKAQTRDFTRAYNTGDEKSFHRDGAWHGPGTVIGSESSAVLSLLEMQVASLKCMQASCVIVTLTGVSNIADSKLDITRNTS